jgi:hypothetical protein
MLQRETSPSVGVLKMNARDVWLGGWLCLIGALSPYQVACAQCVRDVFLALGSSAPPPVNSVNPVNNSDAAADAKKTGRVGGLTTLTEAQILALPSRVIVTETDWTPVSRFEGPLLRDVLRLHPGESGDLNVFALNQYAVTIPMSDLDKYSPILAYSRDGERLKRSDFGPLFIVYPRDQYAELRTSKMAARMAWQVCRIDVQ